MNTIQVQAFYDELEKIALTLSDVGQYAREFAQTPGGRAAIGGLGGAALGGGVGAGIGALTAEDPMERKVRALRGLGIGAAVGGLGGAAIGYGTHSPAKRILNVPESVGARTTKYVPTTVTPTEVPAEALREAVQAGKPAVSKATSVPIRAAVEPGNIVQRTSRIIGRGKAPPVYVRSGIRTPRMYGR